jgi:3-isopropylmalate/(R)-2-methylmalate dehydratase small subunit
MLEEARMAVKGKAWKFGNDVNTDEIIPARYLSMTDPLKLAEHVMEDADPEFPSKVQSGDIIVAGKNFGCGSSREHAPIAIKAAGVSCVIAASFARIFFRNSFNMGLMIFESPLASEGIREGDHVEIDPDDGVIRNVDTGETFKVARIPPFMKELLDDGGLIAHIKKIGREQQARD